jgi:CHAT domain-containing protein
VDHEIVSLPSASVLAVLRRERVGRAPAPDAVAVLADPVFQPDDPRVKQPQMTPAKTVSESLMLLADVERSARESGLTGFHRLRYTRREAEAIAALAPVNARLTALDFAASKTTLLSGALSRYRVVHFATHGLLNSAHPELSGIVLSLVNDRGQPQDGFLRAHEVYNLNLPAELVVLSGCKTGLGKEIKGEGLVGLTRGFMYAGAPRVVVSVWNVSDAGTWELMRRFYQRILKDGLRPTAALREAQVSMWRERRWQAPYY